jgi:hypothetical protein
LAAYAHALEESRIADTESPVGGAP